jgi:hypothetical protein
VLQMSTSRGASGCLFRGPRLSTQLEHLGAHLKHPGAFLKHPGAHLKHLLINKISPTNRAPLSTQEPNFGSFLLEMSLDSKITIRSVFLLIYKFFEYLLSFITYF